MAISLDSTDWKILAAVITVLLGFIISKFRSRPNSIASVGTIKSRDITEVIAKSNKKAVVIYASQTGTAQDYATKFAKELQSRFQLSTLVADTEEYDIDNLSEIPDDILVFFFVSSYGEGEFPDTALEFGEYITGLDEGDIDNLKYAVFGLGNSTYEFFNLAAKNVDTYLEKAGASRIAPYGQGDDGKDTLDEDFLSWKDNTFAVLKDKLSLEEHEATYEPGVVIVSKPELSVEDANVFLGELSKSFLTESSAELSLGPFDHYRPYLAPIKLTKELFNSKTRHCIHVEFDLSESNLKYSTGDHIGILPSNSDLEVDQFLKAFGLDDLRKDIIEVKSVDSTSAHLFRSPTNFESIARYYLEITGLVSRQFLGSIAPFAPTPDAKLVATKLAGNKKDFHEQIIAQKFNIADALLFISNQVPWKTVPSTFVIDSIPRLQPRFYSISSSSLSEKQTIHVTAVVEAQISPNSVKPYITGLATNLLHNIDVKKNNKNEKLYAEFDLSGPRGIYLPSKLPIFVRRSNFKLPTNPNLPVILIGPGTGIAPLRGFVRERIEMVRRGTNIGKIVLFFGCRNSQEDFLYKDEWKEYAKILGDKFEFVTAFSRESDKKVYVQDKMLERSHEIVQLLNDKGFIYVCGDASSMARSVQAALAKILAQENGVSEEAAAETLRSYKTNNRYQEDVW